MKAATPIAIAGASAVVPAIASVDIPPTTKFIPNSAEDLAVASSIPFPFASSVPKVMAGPTIGLTGLSSPIISPH